MLIRESSCGITEIEAKAAKGSGERGGYRASFKSVEPVYYPTTAITFV